MVPSRISDGPPLRGWKRLTSICVLVAATRLVMASFVMGQTPILVEYFPSVAWFGEVGIAHQTEPYQDSGETGPPSDLGGTVPVTTGDPQSFEMPGYSLRSAAQLPNNFTATPIFTEGIVITDENIALKIGGYVKVDLIHDFDAIDATDSFVTSAIRTSGPGRENTRFHARQSRLSFDTRWRVDERLIRAFVEADFFGGDPLGDSDFRLRHAFGEVGRFTAGQTWSTFTDHAAIPATLDFEGAVSSVTRRQALIRWEQPILLESLLFAVALEDARIISEEPTQLQGQARSQAPDMITRLRWETETAEFQTAFLLRQLGYQPIDQDVISKAGWGLNFTGSAFVLERTKGYYQITLGEGIGSYRGFSDVVATGVDTGAILPMFGWMVGVTHRWNDRLMSNVTYSELMLKDIPGQDPFNLKDSTYFAVNLIANPHQDFFCGIEYLHGTRQDVSGASGNANRLQLSFGFFLP